MIDLHVHSIFSDGSFTPEELLAEAESAGISAIALTDHDSVGGLPRFFSAARNARVRAISGVELSTELPCGPVHVLGYDFDSGLVEETLQRIHASRLDRNEKILRSLNKLGVHLDMNDVHSQAGRGTVSRLHFARALQSRGCVESVDEAFEKYLGEGRPAYHERWRVSPEDGVAMIREAGGLAVLAHPFSIKMTESELDAFAGRLKLRGLAGIEALHSRHDIEARKAYSHLADKHGLAVTGGTDFHGASIPDLKLGVGFGDLCVPDELLELLLQLKNG